MGNEGCQETLCTSCIHLQVCSLKETYLKAQKAVNDATISELEPADDHGPSRVRTTYVANLREWLTIPQLKCKHYQKQPEKLTRNFDQVDTTTYLKG